MERVLSGDEKIRRAEEIYYKRKMGIPTNINKIEETPKRYIMSKIMLQLLVIFNLSVIIIAFQNKDYIFTENFLNNISEYNVNLTKSIQSLIGIEIENNQENSESTENVVIENIVFENELVPNEEVISSINQMNLDIENIKSKYNLVLPLKGTVTSLFGVRESEKKNVKGYHTGIDVAADKGTKIKAAASGTVTLVSSKGDYGKHLKIQTDNMETIYAHCHKILVKENEKVEIGQEIATVGNTGNSTGPHLHFEIRLDNRFVDPSKLIMF